MHSTRTVYNKNEPRLDTSKIYTKKLTIQISTAIAHIINVSLYLGRIPDDMKTARVVPLYKTNSKSEPENYRPVSILTVMSTILEKNCTSTVRKLLYDYQSGFRNSYSTGTCLTLLI